MKQKTRMLHGYDCLTGTVRRLAALPPTPSAALAHQHHSGYLQPAGRQRTRQGKWNHSGYRKLRVVDQCGTLNSKLTVSWITAGSTSRATSLSACSASCARARTSCNAPAGGALHCWWSTPHPNLVELQTCSCCLELEETPHAIRLPTPKLQEVMDDDEDVEQARGKGTEVSAPAVALAAAVAMAQLELIKLNREQSSENSGDLMDRQRDSSSRPFAWIMFSKRGLAFRLLESWQS